MKGTKEKKKIPGELTQVSTAAMNFLTEEDAIGSVEMILVLVVLISVVLIFKKQITSLVNDIWKNITDQAGKV